MRCSRRKNAVSKLGLLEGHCAEIAIVCLEPKHEHTSVMKCDNKM